MKQTLFSALLLCVFTFPGRHALAQTATEEQALRTWLGDMIQAWYDGNLDKVAGAYAENTFAVDWTGKKTQGRAAMRQEMAQVLAQGKPTPENMSMKIRGIHFLSANVAVVTLDIKGKTEMNGQPFEWAASDTMVLNRASGKWAIELDQTTGIMPQGQ